jgi:hypothetical protein
VRPHKQHRPQQMIFHRRAFRGGPECNSQRPTARSNALQPGPGKKQNDRPYCGRDDAADQPWYEGNAQQRKMKAETIEGRVSARHRFVQGATPRGNSPRYKTRPWPRKSARPGHYRPELVDEQATFCRPGAAASPAAGLARAPRRYHETRSCAAVTTPGMDTRTDSHNHRRSRLLVQRLGQRPRSGRQQDSRLLAQLLRKEAGS